MNYWQAEENFPTPQKVTGDTQACPNITASYHCFRHTAKNPCVGTAQAC